MVQLNLINHLSENILLYNYVEYFIKTSIFCLNKLLRVVNANLSLQSSWLCQYFCVSYFDQQLYTWTFINLQCLCVFVDVLSGSTNGDFNGGDHFV